LRVERRLVEARSWKTSALEKENNMKTRLALLAVLLLAVPTFAADAGTSTSTGTAAAAFARLKSLVGQWAADTGMGKFYLTYELLSGGHVLVERETSESMHQTMVTTYYLNGDKLELTHYCELGNVPHMVARRIDLSSGEIDFEFADAANLAGDQSAHMHSAIIKIADADHFTSAWTMFENAKPKFTVAVPYARTR
jgi:hypothetical protein